MIVWRGMRDLLFEKLQVARVLAVLLGLLSAAAGNAQAQAPAMEPLDRTVCRLIDDAARTNRLPSEFLTRLIWRESSFRTGAVSPAGAQGIAQFMPGTAQEHGLADPFDPEQAIPKAARLLADLRRDQVTLEEVRREAKKLFATDPGLKNPDHARLRRQMLTRYGNALDLSDVG